MNSILLDNALKAVPDTGLLVNMVRLRVRQLLGGSRPMLVLKPGLSASDIALSEIAGKKLISEPVLSAAAAAAAAAAGAVVADAPVINFPGVKKPAGKAA